MLGVCTPVDQVKDVAAVEAVRVILAPVQKEVLPPVVIDTVGGVTIFTVTALLLALQPSASCISQV